MYGSKNDKAEIKGFVLFIFVIIIMFMFYSFTTIIASFTSMFSDEETLLFILNIFIWILFAHTALDYLQIFYISNGFDNVYLTFNFFLGIIKILVIALSAKEYLKISVRVKETFIR